MPRGQRYEQLGVTEAMVETWGEAIWAMSNNVQVRRGDPIRLRQFDRVAAERASLGMSDGQIAERIGLAREQVMAIRGLVETRRFQRRSYFELLALGRGRRFNAERHVPLHRRPAFSDEALALRDALRFDPAQARAFVECGEWRNETLSGLLAARATATPGSALLRDASGTLSLEHALATAEKVAARLHALGVGRGDVVAARLPGLRAFTVLLVAAARMGAVLLPLRRDDDRAGDLLGIAPARLIVAESGALAPAPCPSITFEALLAEAPPLPEEFVASATDPLLLVPVDSAEPRLAIHTHQTALAGARASTSPRAGLSRILAACVTGETLDLPSGSEPADGAGGLATVDTAPGNAGAAGGWLPAPAGVRPS